MKALIFSLRLRMVWPAMADADSQPDQPNFQSRDAVFAGYAPGEPLSHVIRCGMP